MLHCLDNCFIGILMKIIDVDFVSSEPVFDTIRTTTPDDDHSYITTDEPMSESPMSESPYDTLRTISTLNDRHIYTMPEEELIPDYLVLCNWQTFEILHIT